jgi:hypothetical protein
MVIGDGVFLTPKEDHQMRRIPELVFINCCHLGKIENDKQEDFHRIAANLATEFIRNGVRVVIAAGWAVDDAAAGTFASVFYDEMLSGRNLGDAVQTARRQTYERHVQTNTWGAYQCYGDPGYRLITEARLQTAPEPETFYAPNAAVAALQNLHARLSVMAGQSVEAELVRLAEMRSILEEKGWLKKGRVCAALAAAYGEARCFDDAMRYYRDALKAEDASLSFKDFEQMANLMARAAVAESKTGDAGKTIEDRMAVIDEAIELLEWLCRVPVSERADKSDAPESGEFGATVERLSLLGSTYKRKALLTTDPKDVREALEGMHDSYAKAAAKAAEAKQPEHYPLLNRLAAEIVLDWYQANGKKWRLNGKKLRSQLDAPRKTLQARCDKQPDFWDAVMRVECDLLDALATGALAKQLTALQANYAEVRKLASHREFASALDQLEFFRTMGERAPGTRASKAAKQITALLNSLKTPA